MNVVRTSSKALAAVVGGLLVVVAAAYLFGLAVNRSDRPPSPVVVSFSEVYASSPEVPDARNADIYMLGFSGPPDADPLEIGIRRQARIERVSESGEPESEAGATTAYEYASGRAEEVASLARRCAHFDLQCIEALEVPEAAPRRWIGSEQHLLDRYRVLIALRGFQERRPSFRSPFPAYGQIFEAQRLWLVSAWLTAESGDVQGAASALNDDLVFWRMVLANADTLLSKMLAVTAALRNFDMGNLISRNLQRKGVQMAPPETWLLPLTDTERSMRRSLIGEWAAVGRSVHDPELWDPGGWSWTITAPFWQPQDTSNRYAAMISRYIDLATVPYARMPEAFPQTPIGLPASPGLFGAVYNPIGRLLFDWTESVDMRDYVARVADLEGVRRAAVAAWRLREAGTASVEVEAGLSERALFNPYTGAPFSWDGTAEEIVFTGLGSRGRHAFPY